MSDEELIAWTELLMTVRHGVRSDRGFFLTPLWNAARSAFSEHSFTANLEGLRDALSKAKSGQPLALAMLREFHTQYALQVLIS